LYYYYILVALFLAVVLLGAVPRTVNSHCLRKQPLFTVLHLVVR